MSEEAPPLVDLDLDRGSREANGSTSATMTATQQREFQFAFVPVNGAGRPKHVTDRKLVRSHCMRGKNRRIGVPKRSLSKNLAPEPNARQLTSGSAQALRTVSPRPHIEAGVLEDSSGHSDRSRANSRPKSIILTLSPSDISLVEFAFDISERSKELIFYFMRFAKETMYPAELGVDFNISQCDWFQWLLQDNAYLQCALFTASASQDLSRQKPITQITYSHLRKAIVLLNENLSNTDRAVSLRDSTVSVVLTLTMFSCMINDHAGAKAHILGLQQMVRMRGGIEDFRSNTKLCMKLGRIDLVYALNTGSDGLLCSYPIAYSHLYYDLGPLFPTATSSHDPSIYGVSDPRLAAIFREMQYYTSLMNETFRNKQRRSESEFQTAICSFQYRLLQLQATLDTVLSECLRLAMLAFLITTFQFPGVRAQYPYLADRLRECCLAIEVGAKPEQRDLMRWLLVIGAISVFDLEADTEQWMLERWKTEVGSVGWEEARVRLKEIMWIDALQDGIGKKAFERMNSG